MKILGYIHLDSLSHSFEKSNLITQKRGKKLVDYYKCSKCGLEGFREGFSSQLTITKLSKNPCLYEIPIQDQYIGKIIKIIKCNAIGFQFKNLTPGSRHYIIEGPDGYFNDEKGVWVMGFEEPVKVLNNEFEYCSLIRTKFPK